MLNDSAAPRCFKLTIPEPLERQVPSAFEALYRLAPRMRSQAVPGAAALQPQASDHARVLRFSIEGEAMRGVTWVVIDEVKSGDWAIGGRALTTEAVRELAAGVPAG